MGINNPPPLPQREKKNRTTTINDNTTNNNTGPSDTTNDQPLNNNQSSNINNNLFVHHSNTLPDHQLANNNPEFDTIQLVTITPSNTVTTMDTNTSIERSHSAYRFGMTLPSVTDYKILL